MLKDQTYRGIQDGGYSGWKYQTLALHCEKTAGFGAWEQRYLKSA
jgi:hypothetical protein